MRQKNLLALLLVLVLTVAFGTMAVTGLKFGNTSIIKPVGESMSLGLDLRGGVYTVYYAEQGEYSDAEFEYLLEGTAEVLRSRLTAQNYTEANVSLQGSNYIRVEIPDVQDPQAVLDLLGTPAHLTFRDPYGNVILEGKDVEEVGPNYDQNSAQYVVAFKLNARGTEAFSEATARYRGSRISIYLDDELISDPVVNEQISGGQGMITLGSGMSMQDSYDAAKNLATLIMSGALPIDIQESETRAISATLGEDAIDKAMVAGVIGIIAIFVLMAVIYRLPGLMADLALAIYVIITFYALALLKIQLTLPGIAGILLGIGMAVDANVVIFERFREEMYAGRSYESAAKAAFKNALRAIIDANITTLIAAFVLMYFGTGSIKGFSYTLCLSVIVSMFTAVFVTRFLVNRAVRLGYVSRGVYVRSGSKKNVMTGFAGRLKIFAAIPAVIIVVALVLNIAGSGINLGIDFTGGSLLEYKVGAEFDTEEVKGILAKAGYTDSQVSKVAGDDGEMTHVQIRLKLEDNSEAVDKAVAEAAGLKLSSKSEITANMANTNAWESALVGGTVYTFDGVADAEELKAAIKTGFAANGIKATELNVVVTDTEEAKSTKVFVAVEDGASAVRSLLEAEMKEKYEGFEYVSIEHAGAVSSSQLVKNALMSLAVALVLMLVYIIIRFDLHSGIAALIALFHDVCVMLALMSFLGSVFQVNSSFIAAILTIVGYSINNTIIVFDRVRENKKLYGDKKSYTEITEMSMDSTLARTCNTTITTLITLLALYILGVTSIKEFSFPLIVGMVAGAYSSILLACPLWAALLNWKKARQQKAVKNA